VTDNLRRRSLAVAYVIERGHLAVPPHLAPAISAGVTALPVIYVVAFVLADVESAAEPRSDTPAERLIERLIRAMIPHSAGTLASAPDRHGGRKFHPRAMEAVRSVLAAPPADVEVTHGLCC
jgi:hypothetical protein